MYVSHFEIIFFSGGRKRLKRWRQWFESSPPGWLRWRSSYWCATNSTSPPRRAAPCLERRRRLAAAAEVAETARGVQPSVCRASTTFPLENGSFIPR